MGDLPVNGYVDDGRFSGRPRRGEQAIGDSLLVDREHHAEGGALTGLAGHRDHAAGTVDEVSALIALVQHADDQVRQAEQDSAALPSVPPFSGT